MSALPKRPFAFSATVVSFAWWASIIFFVIPWLGPVALMYVPLWIISLIALLIWDILTKIVFRLVKRSGGKGETIARISPAIILAILLILVPAYESLPRTKFKKQIASPVPESVTNLRIGGFDALLGGETAFYFEISPDDFPKLLEAFPFKQSQDSTGYLDDCARKYLDMTLNDLAPYDVFEVDMLTEEEKYYGAFFEKYIVANKQRNRVFFFTLSGN